MPNTEDFITQVEAVLKNRIGVIITSSILKNNLSKLKTNGSRLTKEDGTVFVEHIEKAVSLFAAGDESKHIRTELNKILLTLD